MTPCSRGCCWNPWNACGKGRSCSCHWDERRPNSRTNGTVTYNDPTATQAVRNVMKEGRPR